VHGSLPAKACSAQGRLEAVFAQGVRKEGAEVGPPDGVTRGGAGARARLHRVPGQGLVFEEPKNESSRRLIVLPKQLLAELRAHKDTQAAERAESIDYWTDHDLVFPNELGGPMDDRNDYRAWVKLLRAAKVRRIRLHDGRHTAATLLLVRRVASDATAGGTRRIA
jgi:integrase